MSYYPISQMAEAGYEEEQMQEQEEEVYEDEIAVDGGEEGFDANAAGGNEVRMFAVVM